MQERVTHIRKNHFNQILMKNHIVSRDGYWLVMSNKNKVNLNAWIVANGDNHNLGDYLSLVIVENMCTINNIDMYQKIKKTRHLYGDGSILLGWQDATIWGSGFISDFSNKRYFPLYAFLHRHYHRTDIRAVRGPETRKILEKMGISCPEVYGAPAVLLPIFYSPKIEKDLEYLVIPHFSKYDKYSNINNKIGTFTTDYKQWINKLLRAKLVISSSLHGIILAEAYGIPAIMLNDTPSEDLTKYRDWYYSTGRYEFPIANTIDEALSMDVVPLDYNIIKKMQEDLMATFPLDLWKD